MVLFLDSTNVRTRIALIDARDASWRSAPKATGMRALPAALAAAERAGALPKKGAACVVVGIAAPGAEAARDASWSTIRAAIAAANGLAFAWGVPATTLALRGGESDVEIVAAAHSAAKKAPAGARAYAAYNAEPNITVPKKH